MGASYAPAASGSARAQVVEFDDGQWLQYRSRCGRRLDAGGLLSIPSRYDRFSGPGDRLGPGSEQYGARLVRFVIQFGWDLVYANRHAIRRA